MSSNLIKINCGNLNIWMVVILLLGLIFQGCSSELDRLPEDFSNNQKDKEVVIGLRSASYGSWKNQLDKLINRNEDFDFILEQGLSLINYKLLDIESVNNTLKEESMIPYYNDENHYNIFTIASVSEIIKSNNKILETLSEFKNILLQDYAIDDLIPVQLMWKYNDYSFETICLTTEEEIIYDDIISNIHLVTRNEVISDFSTPRLKNGSESSSRISYNYSTINYVYTNWLGKECASASATITIYGNKINNVKHMETYSAHGYYNADPGYSADAKMTVTNFTPGANGTCSYQYGVMVGGGGFTLGFDGFGYTVPNGAAGTSGGRYVNASQLN